MTPCESGTVEAQQGNDGRLTAQDGRVCGHAVVAYMGLALPHGRDIRPERRQFNITTLEMLSTTPGIQSRVVEEIQRRLAAAELEHGIKILYCCESGSRAWGFASPDSDYDVRFVYARPTKWYLSFDVERRRDVVEYPIIDEIDCSGWDIRKALYLFTRTNGALLEWLNSPIRYIERGAFASRLRDIAPRAINKIALCYHYSHMARRNAREYLTQDQVRLKKYFYVLRPLLAIRYIEQELGIPPVEFERLVDAVAPTKIRPAIDQLLSLKRQAPELGLGRPIPEVNEFIEAESERHLENYQGQDRPDILDQQQTQDELNEIFRASIVESFPDAV